MVLWWCALRTCRLGEEVSEEDLLRPNASAVFRAAASELAAAVVAAAPEGTAGLHVRCRARAHPHHDC